MNSNGQLLYESVSGKLLKPEMPLSSNGKLVYAVDALVLGNVGAYPGDGSSFYLYGGRNSSIYMHTNPATATLSGSLEIGVMKFPKAWYSQAISGDPITGCYWRHNPPVFFGFSPRNLPVDESYRHVTFKPKGSIVGVVTLAQRCSYSFTPSNLTFAPDDFINGKVNLVFSATLSTPGSPDWHLDVSFSEQPDENGQTLLSGDFTVSIDGSGY